MPEIVANPINVVPTGVVGNCTDADSLKVNNCIIPQYLVLTNQFSIATQMVTTAIFNADRAYRVISFKVSFKTAAGQACLLLLEKCTGTTASGSGTALLTDASSTGIDLNAIVAETLTSGTLTATVASKTLAAGDRLSLKFGTSTSCVGLVCTTVLQAV